MTSYFCIAISRLERAKKLQEQREKELVEKQKQQEMAAGNCFELFADNFKLK